MENRDQVDRRGFLKAAGLAALGLAGSGCGAYNAQWFKRHNGEYFENRRTGQLVPVDTESNQRFVKIRTYDAKSGEEIPNAKIKCDLQVGDEADFYPIEWYHAGMSPVSIKFSTYEHYSPRRRSVTKRGNTYTDDISKSNGLRIRPVSGQFLLETRGKINREFPYDSEPVNFDPFEHPGNIHLVIRATKSGYESAVMDVEGFPSGEVKIQLKDEESTSLNEELMDLNFEREA